MGVFKIPFVSPASDLLFITDRYISVELTKKFNGMEGKTNLQKLPSRVKYYLLEWKDANMAEYIIKYGETKLNDLSLDQLHGLFSYATTKDGALLARIAS